MNNKLTIFLSHSHKDRDKVRKIRDILESLECEPLMFFLKCLDDKNGELEQFIKAEIEARNIFVYCKSQNSENSIWVQKELEYINSFDTKRLYTIDIENDFSMGLIAFLQQIAEILKHNRIFISHSRSDYETANDIMQFLQKNGYAVDIPVLNLGEDYQVRVNQEIKTALQEGVFIPLISSNSMNSEACCLELEYAISLQKNYNGIIFPIVIDDYNNDYNVDTLPIYLRYRELLNGMMYLTVHTHPTEEELNALMRDLKRRCSRN